MLSGDFRDKLARIHAKLLIDVLGMEFHCRLAEFKVAGDDLVRTAVRQQSENFTFL